MSHPHRQWMDIALEEARFAPGHHDVPVGAVMVWGDQVIARAHNRREVDCNPVAHAEMLVLQEAARALGDWRLTDMALYVTLEPCPMCAAAIAQARVPLIVFGAYDPLAGACGSKYTLLPSPGSAETPTVLGGIQESDCATLLKAFFHRKRQAEE